MLLYFLLYCTSICLLVFRRSDYLQIISSFFSRIILFSQDIDFKIFYCLRLSWPAAVSLQPQFISNH